MLLCTPWLYCMKGSEPGMWQPTMEGEIGSQHNGPPICHLWYYNPCPFHYLLPTCIGFIFLLADLLVCYWFLFSDSFFPSACSVPTVNRFILTPVQLVMPCPSITFPLPLPWFSSPRWWQEWCGTSCCPFRADRDPGSPFVTLYTYIVAAGCWAWPPCSLFPASSVFLSLGLAELLEERGTCDHLSVCRLLLLHNRS